MKIAEITSEYNNDFTAVLECEHCGHRQELSSGYHDNYYHTKVIPGIACQRCGKNRAGDVGKSEFQPA